MGESIPMSRLCLGSTTGKHFALHSYPTSLSIKHGTSGVLKPKAFVLVGGAACLLHCKVIFKAQQNGVLWERGF